MWNDQEMGKTNLRFVAAELAVRVCKTLEADRKLDIATPDDVLNLELGKFGDEPQLLNDTRILSRSETGIIFRLGTSHHHLSRGKYQSSCFWVAYTHDDSCETLCATSEAVRHVTRRVN